MQNKPIMLAAGAVAVVILGWLAFGLFGIQAAFIDEEVSEEGPVFASGANAETATASMTWTSTPSSVAASQRRELVRRSGLEVSSSSRIR